jgi:murein DD-endopeptidase MepM/ murein hydrolase activator NlpD
VYEVQMSNRREKSVAWSGRGRAGRLTLALALLAGTAACTASPRYPINMGERAGDGGLTPWQPKYPVSSRDAAQNAADRADGSAVPAGQGAYPPPPASTYAARPAVAPPPPADDDDAPHAMSSSPVDSSDLPPPSPSSAQPPHIESETEAEASLPPGFAYADYVYRPRARIVSETDTGLMPGVILAAAHHRGHKAEDAPAEITLKPGESLETAAKRLGVSSDELMAANDIKDARKVRAGTVLKAPSHAKAAKADEPKADKGESARTARGHDKAETAVASDDAGQQVTLKPGESLEAVAKRLGVSSGDLLAANGIKDARKVRAGTVLKAPGQAAAKPEIARSDSRSAKADTSESPKSGKAGREAAADTSAADDSQEITLKKGESLDAAAKRLGVSRKELMELNGIKNPRKVRAGMVLQAPAHGHAKTESAKAETRESAHETEQADSSRDSYTVKKGDTLYSLGRRFGKDPETLAKLNGLKRAQGLRAGEVLQLSEAEHADRGGRHHAEAAPAEAASNATSKGEIDLSPPDRFTLEAMHKEAQGKHLTRRERQALAREDAREKAAEVAAAKHHRSRDTASEVAADVSANESLSASTRARRAREAAEGPATYNPPPPIGASASATAAATYTPPAASYSAPTLAPAATTVAPPPVASAASAPGQVATLNAPSYRGPSLGRARPTVTEAAPGVLSSNDIAAAGKGRFIWPLKGSVIAPFGDSGPGQHNDGVDIAAQPGDSVRAAAAGEVVYAGSSIPGFGNLVLVKHPGGWVTAYAHLNRIEVRMRDSVAQGDEIGQAGQTGAVDRPLLHFEVRYAPQPTEKARPVDPALVLPGAGG